MKYEIDDLYYNVVLNKKRIKNLYIRYKNGTIYINVPFLIMERNINKILDENVNSLRRMIKKDSKKTCPSFLGEQVDIVSISNLKYPECVNGKLFVKSRDKIDEAYKYLAEPIFNERLIYIHNLFDEDIVFPKLKIRKMKSRWGVCNRKDNSITLNLELIKWGIDYIDYVIVHELSHFVHFNHSKAFWEVVNKYCPSYKIIRKSLRE